MESPSEQLGSYLQKRRKLLRLSQSKVAQLTGKDQSQIARMEAGSGNPSFVNASQILRSLGLELIAVPVRLIPAVRNLIDAAEGVPVSQRTRLVGNDPEAVDEELP